MTITLTLTPEEEAQLRQKAALSGQTPEQVLLAPLQEADVSLPLGDAPLRASLAEWLAEVEAVDAVPHPVPDKNKEYVNSLVEKYRQQGLKL